MDPNAIDNHAWHYFVDANDAPLRRHEDNRERNENEENHIAVPPPPPINNFAEIYLAHLQQYHEDDNIIPYDSDESGDDEPEMDARG